MNLTNAPLGSLPSFDSAWAYRNLGNFTNFAPSYLDPNFRNPRALQWQGGIEQQISRAITVSEDFSYINTVWVARARDTNLGPRVVDATGRNIYSNPRPFGPLFGRATVTEPAGRSLYRGFTTTFKLRRPRYVMDFYYTRSWNYSYDDNERGFTSPNYADVNNIVSEYNYSNIDEPHQFRGTVNYTLPLGFEIASTMKFTAGRPITARTGVDSNQDGITNDRPIVNGVMLKRNSFRNKGFQDVGLRLQKSFTLPNGTRPSFDFRRRIQRLQFQKRLDGSRSDLRNSDVHESERRGRKLCLNRRSGKRFAHASDRLALPVLARLCGKPTGPPTVKQTGGREMKSKTTTMVLLAGVDLACGSVCVLCSAARPRSTDKTGDLRGGCGEAGH